MSSFNQQTTSSRQNAKTRAQKQLNTLRDLSTWIFRHLSDTVKLSKDEVPTEKSEMHRAQFVQSICQAQAQLRQAVSDMQRQSSLAKKIVEVRVNVASREAVLNKCGQSLRGAEQMLSAELFRRRSMPRPPMCSTPVDAEDLLRYASAVSHFSQAASDGGDSSDGFGADSYSAQVGAFPPHPHMELVARSRLFEAAVDRAGGSCRRMRAAAAQSDDAVVGMAEPPPVRPPPKRTREAEAARFAEPRPAKRPFAVPPLEECLRAAAAASSAPPSAGNAAWWWSGWGDAADHALVGAVPARPAAWRPGDLVGVGPPGCAP